MKNTLATMYMYLDSKCWRSWRWERHAVRMELLHGNNIATSQSHHTMIRYHPKSMRECVYVSVSEGGKSAYAQEFELHV